jgi:hypothetical protein
MSTVGVPPISGIGDAIATYSEASAIGISLLRMIVDAHASVCDVFASVNRDVVLSDEDNHVGAFANAGDALGKATNLPQSSLYLGFMRRWRISMRMPV